MPAASDGSNGMEQYGYQKLEMIGRGSFGRVHKVRRTADDKILVIKQMVFGGLADAPAEAVKIRNMAEKESSLLQRLRHPNIVTFHECFLMPSLPHMKVPDTMCVVMSYCAGGDMHQLIKARAESGTGPHSEKLVLWWLVQCLLALRHMHDRHVLHRDLKTSNIFIIPRSEVDSTFSLLKLGDFGMARAMKDSFELADSCVGTPAYMSPEMLKNQPYGPGSDMWSMGCCLYQMMALKNAFVGVSIAKTMEMIVKGNRPQLSEAWPDQPTIYSSGLVAMVDGLLQSDDSKRPTAADMLNDPLLNRSLADYRSILGQQMRSSSCSSSTHSPLQGTDDGGTAGKGAPSIAWDGDLDAMEQLLATVAADQDADEPRLPSRTTTPASCISAFELELDREASKLHREGPTVGDTENEDKISSFADQIPLASKAEHSSTSSLLLSARQQLLSRSGSGQLNLDVAEWLVMSNTGAGTGSSAKSGIQDGGRESRWSRAATDGVNEDSLRSTFDLDELERMVSGDPTPTPMQHSPDMIAMATETAAADGRGNSKQTQNQAKTQLSQIRMVDTGELNFDLNELSMDSTPREGADSATDPGEETADSESD